MLAVARGAVLRPDKYCHCTPAAACGPVLTWRPLQLRWYRVDWAALARICYQEDCHPWRCIWRTPGIALLSSGGFHSPSRPSLGAYLKVQACKVLTSVRPHTPRLHTRPSVGEGIMSLDQIKLVRHPVHKIGFLFSKDLCPCQAILGEVEGLHTLSPPWVINTRCSSVHTPSILFGRPSSYSSAWGGRALARTR